MRVWIYTRLSQDYDFERLGPIIMRDFYENG